MGLFDNLRGLGKRRLGIELGREVSAVEIKGDSELTVAARAPRGGAVGAELGVWLRRWLDSLGVQARTANAVLVDGEIQHHLLTLPEMKDSERHLAVGAEVRKLSSMPAAQIAYGQTPVGTVEEAGLSKQRVLVSVIDKSTLRNAEAAFAAAGLEVASITTVPAAMIEAARRNENLEGGVALAWLSSDRCYLAVLREGVLELVRDFRLRDARDADEALAPLITELRRSFLFFNQRVHGGSVDRLRVAGPLDGIERLLDSLAEDLDVDADLLDAGSFVGDSAIGSVQSAGLVASIGAASLKAGNRANLRAPEEIAEERIGRWVSIGRVAAAIVLVLLIGAGVLAWLDSNVTEQRVTSARTRLAEVNAELDGARRTAQARGEHLARRALLEDRALESSLIGTFLQGVSRSLSDQVVLEQLVLSSAAGPAGVSYWDARMAGLVLGQTRSESQAVFNRFYSRLAAQGVVDSLHLVEPLVIGSEAARTRSPLAGGGIGGSVGGGSVSPRQFAPGPQGQRPLASGQLEPQFNFARELFRERRVTGWGGLSSAQQRGQASGQGEVRTTLDDLPAFGATETSVGFTVAAELKAIAAGGSR